MEVLKEKQSPFLNPKITDYFKIKISKANTSFLKLSDLSVHETIMLVVV